MYMPNYEALWDIYHFLITINGILSDKSDITVLNPSKKCPVIKDTQNMWSLHDTMFNLK